MTKAQLAQNEPLSLQCPERDGDTAGIGRSTALANHGQSGRIGPHHLPDGGVGGAFLPRQQPALRCLIQLAAPGDRVAGIG